MPTRCRRLAAVATKASGRTSPRDLGSRTRRRARALLAAIGGVALLGVGCVHGGAAVSIPTGARGSAEVVPQRSLYRVRFEGAEESGSMRLALYREAEDRFQLRASDTFGRSLWGLSVTGRVSRVVDYRSEQYCESSDEVLLPAVALVSLPVGRLPDLLAGRLPVTPAPGESWESGEFRDSKGRRWTVEVFEGVVRNWTMWEGGGPALWWTKQDRGGVLSHRSGSQFRWRSSVVEPLSEPVAELAPAPEFRRVECSVLGPDGAASGRR